MTRPDSIRSTYRRGLRTASVRGLHGILTTQSYAVFAQATATIFSDTHLTGGARYTWDDRTVRAGAAFGDDVLVSAPNSPQSKSWSSPTWRLVLDHQFTPDIMAYLGYSRGFKSGLFNPVVLPGDTIDEPVDPEILDAYTIGLKSEYLQRRLRVNIEGFYYDYNNIQVTQILAAVSHITNAARATIKGIDLEISAVPARSVDADRIDRSDGGKVRVISQRHVLRLRPVKRAETAHSQLPLRRHQFPAAE